MERIPPLAGRDALVHISWFKRRKISTKLTIAFVAVTLLPLLIYSSLSYWSFFDSIEKVVMNNLSSIADSKIAVIQTYLDEKEHDVEGIAQMQVVIESLLEMDEAIKSGRAESQRYLSAEKKLRRLLKNFMNRDDYYDVFLISAEGDVLFSHLRENDFGANLLRGPLKDSEFAWAFTRSRLSLNVELSNFSYHPPSDAMAAFITAPVMVGKDFIGVCAFQLNNDVLLSHVHDYRGLGNTGDIEVGERVGDEARLVLPARHQSTGADDAEFGYGPSDTLPFMTRAVSGRRGVGRGVDYKGEEVLAVWRYLPQLRWGIVVKQNVDEALKQVYIVRRSALIIALAAICIAFVLARVIGRTFSRPIVDLTIAARDMMSEGVDIVGDGGKSDELEQLYRAFKAMFLAQGELQANLEAKIGERTEELIESLSAKEKNVRELREAQEAMLFMVEDLNRQARELSEAQEAIVRNERLSAIGKLASSVAHELRNPLGVMKNVVYYLNMLSEEKIIPEIRKNLDILSNEIDGSNKIISDLLDFSRIRVSKLQLANVNDVVADALRRMGVYPGIEIETEIDESLPELHIDADQMRQVFFNLAVNACQAMPDGGRLKVSTETGDGYVKIVFEDTGCGISKTNMDKIFEPLFSNKAKGTGLGLSISRALVEDHDGSIEVESEEGKGAIFVVKLSLRGEKDV